MKNYTAQQGARLTLDNNGDCITLDLYSREGLDMLSNLSAILILEINWY